MSNPLHNTLLRDFTDMLQNIGGERELEICYVTMTINITCFFKIFFYKYTYFYKAIYLLNTNLAAPSTKSFNL